MGSDCCVCAHQRHRRPTSDGTRSCSERALETVGLGEPENARVLRIHNTLALGEWLVSEAYRPEIEKREDLEIVEEAQEMAFDANNDLPLTF